MDTFECVSSLLVLSNPGRPVGDFSIPTANPIVAVKSGATTTSALIVSAPFAVTLPGSVALTYSTSSPDLTCSLFSSTVTLPTDPAAQVRSILTINTRLPASASGGVENMLLQRSLMGSATTLALLFAVCTTMLGCSSHGPATTPPTTPTGAYNVVVTGIASGITHTLVIKVLVQ